jgi:hypothetical protein
MNDPARKSWPARIYRVLSGYGLATVLLLILMIQTWMATLEQVHYGLFPTLRKYFDAAEFVVIPDAGIFHESLLGKKFIPMPGGYWVCALLVLNLTLGGIVRIRKGLRTVGVLLAHFGIIFMVVAGGVAQLKEERGVMMLSEEENGLLPKTADYATSLTDTSIEIIEVKDGEPVGPVRFIPDGLYRDLGEGTTWAQALEKVSVLLGGPPSSAPRKILLPGLPFDLEVQRYIQNAKAMSTSAMAPDRGEPVVDGWFLFAREPSKETEMDTPGIHVRVLPRDGGETPVHLLVSGDSGGFEPAVPVTVRADGRTFLLRLDKRVWPVPFEVTLVDARSEYYPNTNRPKLFESDIIRTEGEVKTNHFIEMNEPMREGGLTFYQRTMMNGPAGRATEATISGFEVVRNPSDKWPEISIYISGFGLCLHFLIKLWGFLFRGKSSATATPATQS